MRRKVTITIETPVNYPEFNFFSEGVAFALKEHAECIRHLNQATGIAPTGEVVSTNGLILKWNAENITNQPKGEEPCKTRRNYNRK